MYDGFLKIFNVVGGKVWIADAHEALATAYEDYYIESTVNIFEEGDYVRNNQ